jgi:hypothetical protein
MRTVLLVLSVAVAIALQVCTDTERLMRLDRRDAFHTPVGEHCAALPGGSYTVCGGGEGYCFAAICRATCGGEDKLTCGPNERAVAVDPPSHWPCACVPIQERQADESLPAERELGALSPRQGGKRSAAASDIASVTGHRANR